MTRRGQSRPRSPLGLRGLWPLLNRVYFANPAFLRDAAYHSADAAHANKTLKQEAAVFLSQRIVARFPKRTPEPSHVTRTGRSLPMLPSHVTRSLTVVAWGQ